MNDPDFEVGGASIPETALALLMKNGIARRENGESLQSVAVTESMSDPAPLLTIDRRRANAVIEQSSFPGANVSSTVKKQENTIYSHCTFHYDNANPKSPEKTDTEAENVSPNPQFQAASPAERSPTPFLHNHRKPSHEFDNESYTKVSEKIYFYNIQPLRKRSRVYLGKQKHASNKWRNVAVKLVPHNERNLREIEFLLDLEGHSNIVKIIESHEIFGHVREIYIAMELCSQNLREYISSVKEKPVNFDILASYSKQVINGLAYIHSNKIIHGDLKPDNILFSQNMKYIKISDFGLSEEALDEKDAKNSSSSLPGTEGFRAPEVYLDPPELMFASDVFSIAIVIFYLTTLGYHPFGDQPHDWGYNIRYSKNRDLSFLYRLSILPSTKLSLYDLVGSSLRKDPSRRPIAKAMLRHEFFEGVPCEIHVLDVDEILPSPQRKFDTVDFLGLNVKEDKVSSPPGKDQIRPQNLTKSNQNQQPSFESSVSSQSSLQNPSGLSSDASLHQRLDDLEYRYNSLARFLDSKAVGNPEHNNAVFNSYPRSSNLQYPSDITSLDANMRPDHEPRCATTSRIPSPKPSFPNSYSEWFSNERTSTPRRQASMRVRSPLKAESKACFKRSDSFSYNRFQMSQYTAVSHDSTQRSDTASPALPDKTPKKPSTMSKLRKIFKKKEK